MGSDEFNPITDIVFECRIDSTNPTAWEDCEYPAEYLNLSPGEHTFEVRAIDMLGQGLADPTPAQFTWTYVPLPSGVAPQVILDVTPPAETFLLDAIFTFHSNEPDVAFQCSVDSNGYEPCGFEGATFMNQGAFEWGFEPNEVGPHTFSVRAIDFEGNVGQPTTYTWRLLGRHRRVHRRAGLHAGERRPAGRPGDRRPDGEQLGGDPVRVQRRGCPVLVPLRQPRSGRATSRASPRSAPVRPSPGTPTSRIRCCRATTCSRSSRVRADGLGGRARARRVRVGGRRRDRHHAAGDHARARARRRPT